MDYFPGFSGELPAGEALVMDDPAFGGVCACAGCNRREAIDGGLTIICNRRGRTVTTAADAD